MENFEIEIVSGEKKAKIAHDGYDMNLFTMRNGFQWTAMPVDDELISMLETVIAEYKEMKRLNVD